MSDYEAKLEAIAEMFFHATAGRLSKETCKTALREAFPAQAPKPSVGLIHGTRGKAPAWVKKPKPREHDADCPVSIGDKPCYCGSESEQGEAERFAAVAYQANMHTPEGYTDMIEEFRALLIAFRNPESADHVVYMSATQRDYYVACEARAKHAESETRALREALEGATRSLESLANARESTRDDYFDDMAEVRRYATARAIVYRTALAPR